MQIWLGALTAPLGQLLRQLDTAFALQGIENARDAMLENERRRAMMSLATATSQPEVPRTA
jgi:hypothetical protein